jgi:hypothetical protein
VTRTEELAAIDDFIATHGVVRCPAKFALPTLSYVPTLEAARRLAELGIRKASDYAWLQAAARIYMASMSRH